MRLTRRGRVVATGLAALLVGGAAYGISAGEAARSGCVVSLPAGDLSLTRGDAARVTEVAAAAGRDERGVRWVASGVRRMLGKRAGDDPAALARALLGHRGGALTCPPSAGTAVVQQTEGPDGLTPRAGRLRDELLRAFGPLSLGGFAPGGVRSGHMPGSAHYEGRAIDVFFRPVTAAQRRDGWAVAQWAVAHGQGLDVQTVIFDRRVWTASRGGWRDYRSPGAPTDNPVLLHLDHVHLDVIRGD